MTRIYNLSQTNVYKHLALEEYLLDHLTGDQQILMLWRSGDSVVIGKNQNPWKECLVSQLKRDGVNLARRLSGGGTVYHNSGNLNFTFLSSREHYDFKKQIQCITDAMSRVGINAKLDAKSAVLVNGRKCSGNAFCFRKDRAFHHGTLLINADIDRMTRYLHPADKTISGHAIDSNKAPVINLTEVNPSLSVDSIVDLIIDCYLTTHPGGHEIIRDDCLPGISELDSLYNKYISNDWIYGYTPRFQVDWQNQFEWGTCRLSLTVVKGIVHEMNIHGENLNSSEQNYIISTLTGCPFESVLMARKMRPAQDKSMGLSLLIRELANWIEKKDL